MRFDNCTDVRVEGGLSVLNPPFWAVVPTRCAGVRIHNVSVVAPVWTPNTDGIELMASRDVAVTGRDRCDNVRPSLLGAAVIPPLQRGGNVRSDMGKIYYCEGTYPIRSL